MQLSAVERFGERLRLSASGPHDDELLDTLDALDERRRGALERRARQLGARRLEAWPLICTISSALHETEVGNVARDRCLRRVEPALTQTPPQLFLAVQRFVIDRFEDDGLTSCFHGDSMFARIHDLCRLRPRLFIDFY